MLLRKPFLLVPGLVGVLLAGCGSADVSPAQVELNLVAASSPAGTPDDHIALKIVSIEAQIDGRWRTLSSEHQDIALELGVAPRATRLLAARLPAGALSAVRLGIGEFAQHLELSAACGQEVPACATGSMSFVLENPRACARGGKHSDARLKLLSLSVASGTCEDAPDLRTVDLAADLDPACVGIVCPPTQECRAGLCVQSDSCVNIVCAPGQVCSLGQCVPITDMSSAPDLATSVPDLATPPKDMCGSGDPHRCTSHPGPGCQP